HPRQPFGDQQRFVAGEGDGKNTVRDAALAGDEPLLIAERLPGVPVVVGADRARAARAAVADHSADCLVMDDGFQHLRLHRDRNLLCVDALSDPAVFSRPFGALLPAGPLREPPSGLRRADLVFLTKANLSSADQIERWRSFFRRQAPDVPVVPVRYELSFYRRPSGELVAGDDIQGRAVLAFTGLARPESFEAALRRSSADVFCARFPDHHFFTAAEREGVLQRAERENRRIITTEKDAQRLPPDFPCLVAKLDWRPDPADLERKGADFEWTRVIVSAIS
ncbi:MAG TPA: tetraacyldisaccharide 4'-kinase, partial [Elusimicrobiota bacterium]|nr:tetraacyldisaccharide 4'-kinase [Elusimicrobiota bacterium]